MHFLAPFGHLYGVFCPNGQQIEAKCIYPHCSVEKLACNNTVRARTWRNITERSLNLGKECIFLHRSAAFMVFSARTVTKLRQRMRFPALFSRKTSPQQYRSGKNLAEHNRTVSKLRQRMHFLAPFGHLYGVFRPNGHQIEAKCIYPHCSVEKLARNNTVRAKTWLNITERSPHYGKKCISSHRSATFMVFSARTVSKLRQKMRFPPERLTSATLLWQKCGRYPLRMRNLPRFYG